MNEEEYARNQESDKVDREEEQDALFDFEEHRRNAVAKYLRVQQIYDAFAKYVKDILDQALKAKNIAVNSVDARAKEPESFGDKAQRPSDDDTTAPRYRCPLKEITDLAGVRIITFFPGSVSSVGDCIREEFDLIEYTDHSQILLEEERFGYLSEHYLVRLSSKRTGLPEYKPYVDLVAEIQVRTILQHAWAEIEHDIQYKSSVTTPSTIRRRFVAVAGLLEIADREFQAIQDEDETLKQKTGTSVEKGALDDIEITAHALQSYLENRSRTDERRNDSYYENTARVLRRLGFSTMAQVDACTKDYDLAQLTNVVRHGREGPPIRFEDVLLAAMGPIYVDRLTEDTRRKDLYNRRIARYKDLEIPIGNYDPAYRTQGQVNQLTCSSYFASEPVKLVTSGSASVVGQRRSQLHSLGIQMRNRFDGPFSVC